MSDAVLSHTEARGRREVPGEATMRREPRAAEHNPRAHARRERLVMIALGIAVPVLLFWLWEIASTHNWIDQRSYPPPSRLAKKLWHVITGSGTYTNSNGVSQDDSKINGLFGSPSLWSVVWTTVKRVLWGFGFGVAIGTIVGLVMGMSRYIRAAFEPLFNALYTVPKLALTPVFFTIFGIRSDMPLIAIVALTTFFFMWISTMVAVMAVPEGYREAGASLGMNHWDMFRHVLWPAALPQIATGLRIAAGVAILTVLGAELLLGQNGSGLGSMIYVSKELNLFDQMYTGIVIAAAMGVVFTSVVTFISRRLVPWAPKDRGVRIN